jgi:uncharacterized membrane protein
MRRFVNWFLQGMVFLVPIAVTVWLVVSVMRVVDGWLGIPIPGLGIVVTVGLTTLVGFLATNFLTRRVLDAIDHGLDRLPFVKLLHTSTKDLMNAFIGEKKRFTQPVAVELVAGSGVLALGFVTDAALAHLDLGDQVAVYLPQSYNFAGQLLIVPRDRVRNLQVENAHLMAFIVSGGVSGK